MGVGGSPGGGGGGGGGTGTVSAARHNGTAYVDDTDLKLFIGPVDPKVSTGGRDQPGDLWIDGAPDPTPPVRAYVWNAGTSAYVEDVDFAVFVGPQSPVSASGGRDQPNDLWIPLGADATAAPVPGQILGWVSYDPVTLTSTAVASATYADVDATNVVATFVVPPSGNVVVELSGLVASGAARHMGWGIREGSTLVKAAQVAGEFADQHRITVPFVVTGLTPGVTKTYKFAHARLSGSGNAITGYGGATGGDQSLDRFGPISMFVRAL